MVWNTEPRYGLTMTESRRWSGLGTDQDSNREQSGGSSKASNRRDIALMRLLQNRNQKRQFHPRQLRLSGWRHFAKKPLPDALGDPPAGGRLNNSQLRPVQSTGSRRIHGTSAENSTAQMLWKEGRVPVGKLLENAKENGVRGRELPFTNSSPQNKNHPPYKRG